MDDRQRVVPVHDSDLEQVSSAVGADVHDHSLVHVVGVDGERLGVQRLVCDHAMPASALSTMGG
jgi:hypothetical protein